METITVCLKSVFPQCDTGAITTETALGHVPGWDSMNSVNFLLELEAAFQVSLGDEVLTAKHHMSDVVELLRRKGVQI